MKGCGATAGPRRELWQLHHGEDPSASLECIPDLPAGQPSSHLWAGEAGRDESVTQGGRGTLSYRPCQNMQDLAESFVLFPFSRLWHCMFMGISWRDALQEGKLKEGPPSGLARVWDFRKLSISGAEFLGTSLCSSDMVLR